MLTATFVLVACDNSDDPTPTLPPGNILDLLEPTVDARISRVAGSEGSGRLGVPVAGGFDVNGDGHLDYALASMRSPRDGEPDVGKVFLIFGDSTTGETLDTAMANNRVLPIVGAERQENTGSEIWMDDVNGDGLGDLIIGRQNFTLGTRTGAGAVTILRGDTSLSNMAASGDTLDLADPPPGLSMTFVGAFPLDRLGMWMRTGDVNGDDIADMAIGADQADTAGESNAGTVYLIMGGTHLNLGNTIDLLDFGTTVLAGRIAKLNPPSGAERYHFGASLSVGDLDGNGRAEVFVAASLDRAGGSLPAAGAAGAAFGSGGNPGGSLFIYWDELIPDGLWPSGLTIDFDSAPGVTRIDGGTVSGVFSSARLGEEVLPPQDYNGDGSLDLFLGDITGDPVGRNNAGLAHILFSAAELRGESFSIDSPPTEIAVTHVLGPITGAIFGDTAAQGDLDGDGLIDLAIGSPHDSPNGRDEAGSVQILWGQANWPEVIDLAPGNRPEPNVFTITDILGAFGTTSSNDDGDTLMYSGTAADVTQDGRDDLIINEMKGNGIASDALDVGNLIIIPGAIMPR
ncbi:MAG: FG-GAP repeat protein [Pseudomonadota bacterium]